jgi:hypothetical protein
MAKVRTRVISPEERAARIAELQADPEWQRAVEEGLAAIEQGEIGVLLRERAPGKV